MFINVMAAVGIIIGFAVFNFIWQAFTEHDWARATVQSVSQAIAIGVFLVYLLVTAK
ncbi:MAG: hypothetical protein UU98_C0042G0006 [Parcubacteria group bacterium GW2011_GWD2_42_14]|nr:MAG: hypothetical protein UU98_C0042G0006 [Parcubacteria group bacterium GW2011_GWD2_42_14]